MAEIFLSSPSEESSKGPDTTFAITGIPYSKDVRVYEGKIPWAPDMPARREITEWHSAMIKSEKTAPSNKLTKQWTLFILALEKFKAMTVEQKLSYFQIAGIHGFPETAWDSAPDPPKDPKNPGPGDNPFGGYCHHNTIAFPTWHRPYMLLFEQCLWLKMYEVIAEFKKKYDINEDEWRAAANDWRLPYWDWARPQPYLEEKQSEELNARLPPYGIPYVFTLPEVPIWLPKDGKEEHPNPLVEFENPEKEADGKTPRLFGNMPEGKTQWNIKDNGIDKYNDENEPVEACPWSKTPRTSRWSIVRDPIKDGSKPEDWPPFSGLNGVNNYQFVNIALSNAANRFYLPRRLGEVKEEIKKKYPGVITNDLADAVNRMFSEGYNGTWGIFASTKWYNEYRAKLTTGYMSLEYIHNNIHNITGGSYYRLQGQNPKELKDNIWGAGHMSDVPVAAFDPIFWLHHCNIDRYTAMWQALYPDKWWDETEPENPVPDPKLPDKKPPPEKLVPDRQPTEPLLPFHKTAVDPNKEKPVYWTSNDARNWTQLGYGYDDMVPKNGERKRLTNEDGSLKEEDYQEWLRAHINNIYPSSTAVVWSLRQLVKQLKGKSVELKGPKTTEDQSGGAFDFTTWAESLTKDYGVKANGLNYFKDVEAEPDQPFNDYIINVVYDRYALEGKSYSIRFYLRPGDEYHAEEIIDDKGARIQKVVNEEEYFVGQIYSLGGMTTVGEGPRCANCKDQKNTLILSKGQVLLTVPLFELALDDGYRALNSTNPSEVEAFLKKNLYWKYVAGNGTVLDAKSEPFKNTAIAVWRGEAQSAKPKSSNKLVWLGHSQKPTAVYETPSFGADGSQKLDPYKPLWGVTEDKGDIGGMLRDGNLVGASIFEVFGDKLA